MVFADSQQFKGKGVKAVIIDSGLKSSHAIIKDKTISGYSLKNGVVCFGAYDDNIGHGTAVYSLINNIVPETEFVIFKIFDSDFYCTQDALETVLEYICDHIPCDVINISSGTCVLESEHMYNICKKIAEKQTIILSAFDNTGAISFPAAFDCVIGVDASTNCKTMNEFEYVDDSIINIRAKAGMHRVAWTYPEYAFVEGTSFSVAYATAMTIKLVESGCRDFNEILGEFKKNAISIHSHSCLDNQNQFSIFTINKAIVFPYSKEVDSFVRFSDLLRFKIDFICDYRLSGKVGMNISKKSQFAKVKVNEFIIKDIEKIDWNKDFDTVILGYTDKISKMAKCDYKEYVFKMCIKYKKNLYMFDYSPQYNMYVAQMKECGLQVFYPSITKDMVPRNRFGKMYMNSKPIVGIFGTSSHQGKFTLQLELLKSFSPDYKLSLIGTEPTSPLFGMDFCFPMGYHSTVETVSYDSVFLLNDMIHKLSTNDVDLILVCSQYASIPFDIANISMFTNNQYDFLLGTQPEAIVLTINPFDDFNYIKRTIMFLESAVDAKVIAIVIYPVNFTNDWTGFYGKKRTLTRDEYIDLKNKYEKSFNIPVLSLNDNINILKEIILDYFS